MVKDLPAMQETRVGFLGREDPLKKEMAIHPSTLARKIPRAENPGGLQSKGLQRLEHDSEHSHTMFLNMTLSFLTCLHFWKQTMFVSSGEHSCSQNKCELLCIAKNTKTHFLI